MTFLSKNNIDLLQLFKITTIIHIVSIILKLILYPYITHGIIYHSIQLICLLSFIIIGIITCIKSLQIFIEYHRYFIKKHKLISLLIESLIIIFVVQISLINRNFTNKFILFITKLSQQTHNKISIYIILLLTLLYSIKLKKFVVKKSIDERSILMHFKAVLLQSLVVFISFILFLDPIMQPLQQRNIESFIITFTTKNAFLWIYNIIVILIGLWILIGIYYLYQLYRRKRR